MQHALCNIKVYIQKGTSMVTRQASALVPVFELQCQAGLLPASQAQVHWFEPLEARVRSWTLPDKYHKTITPNRRSFSKHLLSFLKHIFIFY